MKFGSVMRLEIYGESHSPAIGVRLENFPAGLAVDFEAMRAFLARRAPGRDELSTPRREDDAPEFLSGLDQGVTTGEMIEAVIRNTNVRPADYERFVPRPGHADYPVWAVTGRIPSGGGANSGRMTAPMCVAGALCLQWLTRLGITVSARVVEIGGKAENFTETILAAKQAGDSVGGVIAAEISRMPVGIGGPMFDGLESQISAAVFGIPGVKGIEFGNGFEAARLRGSENNDAFAIADGKVVTATNRHGGILGGRSSGMPITFRVAMKPTPSIFLPQRSVDLSAMREVEFSVRGRHDPCIALRAVPVVEAVSAFAVMDVILRGEK